MTTLMLRTRRERKLNILNQNPTLMTTGVALLPSNSRQLSMLTQFEFTIELVVDFDIDCKLLNRQNIFLVFGWGPVDSLGEILVHQNDQSKLGGTHLLVLDHVFSREIWDEKISPKRCSK
ncbi:hypothetical protein BDV30DRAFT_221979 [Aspergillus minisclerotigenes]|uniref:Uncharacterized protein n=1 Tax=Aspergillus minisclerotigenes TaxID=656917 RepID=A0A5N6IJN4_9EURO|nr:hypothetical protein BDV30DRAFT_221979 [Aspergillus minisclerotigenes]